MCEQRSRSGRAEKSIDLSSLDLTARLTDHQVCFPYAARHSDVSRSGCGSAGGIVNITVQLWTESGERQIHTLSRYREMVVTTVKISVAGRCRLLYERVLLSEPERIQVGILQLDAQTHWLTIEPAEVCTGFPGDNAIELISVQQFAIFKQET